jgi:ribonuclease P/MRP protein subunit RPP1
VDNEKSSRKMAELLRSAGYSTVALTVPTGLLGDKLSSLRRIFEHEGLETLMRVDLTANSRMDLLRLLRRFRNAYDIVAVKCVNQRAAAVACRDRRVDLVFFDPVNSKTRFGHPLASLIRSAFELNLISTFLGETRGEVFSRVAKEAAVAREHRTTIVLSSGCQSPMMVKSPSEISAIGIAIGLSREQSSRGLSDTPFSIIKRNLERRGKGYVEDGVKLVLPAEGGKR